MADRVTNQQVSDKLHLIYLQLPLFDLKNENECKSDFDRWIYVLKNMEILERMPFLAQNAVFQRLADIGDISKLSREDRMKYDSSIKQYRDALATMEYTYVQGEDMGITKGITKGIKQVARKMKSLNYNVEDIAVATGLSVEEINEL